MSDTFCSLTYHLVFSTKDRIPLITRGVRGDLFSYIGGIVRGIGGAALAVGGMSDHIHLVVTLPTSLAVADTLRVVKSNSSKWMNRRSRNTKFGWQRGYGAFSVSQSMVPIVMAYVVHQECHHQKRSFSDEFNALVSRHGLVDGAPSGSSALMNRA